MKLTDEFIDVTIFELMSLKEKLNSIDENGNESLAMVAMECLRRAEDSHAKALDEAGIQFRNHMRTIKQMMKES